MVKCISWDKKDTKKHPEDEIHQNIEDEVFIKDKSNENNVGNGLEAKIEKNFTLKLLKSPLVWLLSLQFFLGSLRVYTGTGLMYDSIYFAVKNQTSSEDLEPLLRTEMDIFVGIQSILVPVSSPIFGFILDSVQMAFGKVHYSILSGFRNGSLHTGPGYK